jgi:hypothetical protein
MPQPDLSQRGRAAIDVLADIDTARPHGFAV